MATVTQNNKAELVGTDPLIEKWLKDKAVDFDFITNVAPGSFDADRSLENQARMGSPLNDEVVDRYIAALKAGDVFPPLVAYRLSNGKLEVLDGNHRRAAHAELGQAMDVYVVDPSTPPAMRSLITFEANTKHGLPSSASDRLHHALYMVDNGKSVAAAAALFGVPLHALQKEVTRKNATRRAEDCEVPLAKWNALPMGIQVKLQTVSTDEGFAAAANLAADANLPAQAVSEMVKELNKTRSVAKQRASLDQWREDAKPDIQKNATHGNAKGRRGGAMATIPGRLNMALGQLKGAFRESELPLMTPNQREEVTAKLEEIERALDSLKKQLQDA